MELTIFEHAGSDNTARADFVDDAIFFLIALVHHQVAIRDWQANSQPVASIEEIPQSGGQRFVTGILS